MDVIIRPGHKPYRLKRGSPDPSPQEIEARCAEIRATWTPEERWKRMRSDWRATYRRADGEQIEFEAADYDAHIAGQVPLELSDEDYDDLPD